ncbi:DNA gyrase subunit A, partial [Candidatus Curtissbacteria bacterium]|nr:DNA gyrase subunit A [Candidatus Curtissbacteria bacterium]
MAENVVTDINYIGQVIQSGIVAEMKRSYLDYAMSVIVARALPDVRDGLKPVQRRIIYAMYKVGLSHTAHYSKCAKVVGEVLGKYHPHGDSPVYEALVRMAQDFSLRYPLIDGQGNFGSVDGDRAAAMRYTECRMSAIASELLRDMDKDTVTWGDNFDGTLKEPNLLPSVIPNLLLNGVNGIAVGMATSIPPHNLSEVIDATVHLIDNPEASVEDLLRFIKGPDFPTGGIIYDQAEITAAYATGRGRIITRAKADIEERKNGKFQIIITELPYQVNKSVLIQRMADLVRNKKIQGIADLRDDSDRKGMRITIELRRDAKPQSTLNNLFKLTAMQQNFSVNAVGLIDGVPQTMTLNIMLSEFIKHRQNIITKRSEFDLKAARAREHILEGLKIAVDNIDEVIRIIRAAPDADTAKGELMTKFKLSELQAVAILDMQLRRLAALERLKIEEELKQVREMIAYLEDLLSHPEKILLVAKNELLEIKEKYGDARRTKIVKNKIGEFSEEDLVANEPTIVTITQTGYIKRQLPSTFKTQRRGGKGVSGITTKEEDVVSHLIRCQTHDSLMFFTNRGRVFQLKTYEVPESSRVAKGQAIINLIDIEQREEILSILPIAKTTLPDANILLVTKKGVVKKTAIEKFSNIRKTGIIAINLDNGDELRWAKLTSGSDYILIVSDNGQSIKFNEKNIRSTARDTRGVRGINLKVGGSVIGLTVGHVDNDRGELLIVTENGFGKKSLATAWTMQGRGGKGVKAANITAKTGKIVSAELINAQDESLVLTSKKGQIIRLPLKNIPKLGRDTQGVTLMRFSKSGDTVS